MQFNRFTWLDRVGNHLNRRILTKLDGTQETVDVTRGDDSVTVEGSPFSAETMNGLEGRIETAFNECNSIFQSIDTNISGINTDVNNIYVGSTRVNYIENTCLLDDGTTTTATGYALSPLLYLPETTNTTFLWGCRTHSDVQGTGHAMALIFYNSSGAVVQTFNSASSDYIDIPSGAIAVRASFYIPDSVDTENNIMLTIGTETPYVFYKANTQAVNGLVGLDIKASSAISTANEACRRANSAYTLANNTANQFVSGGISVSSSVGTVSKLHAYKAGKIVNVNFTLALSQAVSAWAEIAVLTGSLPLDHTAGHYVNTSTPSNSGALRILKSGKVNALIPISSGQELEINITYITN